MQKICPCSFWRQSAGGIACRPEREYRATFTITDRSRAPRGSVTARPRWMKPALRAISRVDRRSWFDVDSPMNRGEEHPCYNWRAQTPDPKDVRKRSAIGLHPSPRGSKSHCSSMGTVFAMSATRYFRETRPFDLSVVSREALAGH